MYRNFSAAEPNQHDLEKKLSKLECAASEICKEIIKRQGTNLARPNVKVHLVRRRKNLLRRFLFIMMYRNRTFQSRFKNTIAEYDSNDRVQMVAYMNEKGFTSPKDVWYSNILGFLEIDLERESKEWYEDLAARVFPADALWFLKNMESSFLSICTTQDHDDEFIMTPNAYSIYEGSNDGDNWTDHHVFAPISPTLMLVARSHFLPTGQLDHHKVTRQVFGIHSDSIFNDLPIRIAENNYSRMVNGTMEPLPTKMAREKHIFNFSFFALSTTHVQRINAILLEEAMGKEGIVYKSKPAFQRALEHYLANKTDGFKRIPRLDPVLATHFPPKALEDIRKQQGRLPYLKLLERIVHDEFGSEQEAVYEEIDAIRTSFF